MDGSFKIITKLAKIEKTVADAHKGALIALKWSKGGVDLATAGEDGQIRVFLKKINIFLSKIMNFVIFFKFSKKILLFIIFS